MNYREVKLLPDKSVPDSGTETIDINLRSPITELIIRFRVTNEDAVSNHAPHAFVTKIEIVDGGQVYYSLSGPQAMAASAYGLGRYPYHWYDGRDAMWQLAKFHLLFGRYVGDEQFAFDPRKLLNPQLKITWADEPHFENDSVVIGVTARIMEGVPAPAQCLMWREVEAWNTADSGDHIVDLPVNLPIRALMHRVYLATEVWMGIHTHFKLDCDMGDLIVFDLAEDEYKDITKEFVGPFRIFQHGVWSHGDVVQGWLGEIMQASVNDGQGSAFVNASSAGAYNWFRIYVRNHENTELSDRSINALCTGWYPENCILYPFGRSDVPETWFNAPAYKGVQFKITEATADAAASVCVQQPRRLP